MRVISLRIIQGPNVYHHLPVAIMRIDLENWIDKASNEIPGFIEKLKQTLPGLYEHTCSVGTVGGFYERLKKGTYLAHVTEHVALELTKLAGFDIGYGKSRYTGKKGLYDIILRYTHEEGVKECLRSAVKIVDSLLTDESVQINELLENIKTKAMEKAFGLSGECIFQAAKILKIPVTRLANNSLVQLGYGKNMQRVQAAITSRTGLIAADIVQDKELTKNLLNKALVPTPFGVVISAENEIEEAVREWSGPYVFKPIDGNHGKGVFLNLQTVEELKSAFRSGQKYSDKFLIEKMQFGKDYRVLVVDGRFTAAAERIAPQVTGDGKSTISQLIDIMNQDPLRGEGHDSFFTRIVPDEALMAYINKQNLSLESILKPGQVIQLRGNANLSSGGTAIDVTAKVSEEVQILCERVARISGLDICGIDVISKDISASVADGELNIIEVNAGPGLRMHLLGKQENEENVGTKIVKMLYPNPASSRIPIVAVTGTNGKTTVVRLLQRIVSDASQGPVGMTNTDGIWIGKKKIASGDMSGPSSAAILLQDSAVESAVFEIARGGLLRSGLAYDWSDVAVFTNISEDHLGQDGIEFIEDLVWIKSLVGERVKKNGTVVLNADDPNCLTLLSNHKIKENQCRFILFSIHRTNSSILGQLAYGATGLWIEDGHIIVADKLKVRSLGHVGDIPITVGGKADFQVANVLAALGGALALGIGAEQILRSLKDFHPSLDNSGRMNLYKVNGGYVILDYGHNPDAISRMGQFLNKFKGYTKTAILGLPGDRSDDLIKETGRQAAQYFDKVILRDELDLRGRNPSEIPTLLSKLYKEEFPNFLYEIISNEEKAVFYALNQVKPQTILTVFCENISAIEKIMEDFGSVPALDLISLEEKTEFELAQLHGAVRQ